MWIIWSWSRNVSTISCFKIFGCSASSFGDASRVGKERSISNRRMYIIIVSKLHKGKKVNPIILLVVDETTKTLLDGATARISNFRDELWSLIIDYVILKIKLSKYFMHNQFYIIDSLSTWKEMWHLNEPIQRTINGIKTLEDGRSRRKSKVIDFHGQIVHIWWGLK